MLVRTLAVVVVLAGAATVWAVSAPGQVPAPPETAAPVPYGLVAPKVAPKRAFFGRRAVRVDVRFTGDAPLDLRVEFVRGKTRKVVRSLALPAAQPNVLQRVRWDALTTAGRAAPEGRYSVRVVTADGRRRRAGAFTLRGHMYPIRGSHADRGPVGEFGVGRNGGRTHEGFDVNARCGVPLVAARAGRVTRSRYDPVLYGHEVIIRGRLNNRSYRYAHLRDPPLVSQGDIVRTGQQIGLVGRTGNARTVGCHLHFELRAGGVLIDPKGPLHAWDRSS